MWKVPATGADVAPERAQLLTQETGIEAEESADRKTIYFYRPNGQNLGQLYAVPASGGAAVKVMDENRIARLVGSWAQGDLLCRDPTW
jgi:hypothetical protein